MGKDMTFEVCERARFAYHTVLPSLSKNSANRDGSLTSILDHNLRPFEIETKTDFHQVLLAHRVPEHRF
jgi:hypothetical protein